MAAIESYVQPRRLYRYRSLARFERELDAIKNAYLYCSAYMDLNDPMEGLFTSSTLMRKSENYRQIRNAIRDNKAQIGVCSFSEVHNHELMWAHYANKFRGICVAYSLTRLLKNLADDVRFVRMYYDQTVPTLHRTSKDPRQLAKMVLSYKNYRWLYEREWRMFATLGKAYYTDVACVTKVYLGSRMEAGERKRIVNALEQLGIKTSDMTIDEYFISFEDIDHE
ncbi:MAG: DUF2971 domain-containing protein [Terriglobia bacterium]